MIYSITNHQRQPVCWVAVGAKSMGRGQGGSKGRWEEERTSGV